MTGRPGPTQDQPGLFGVRRGDPSDAPSAPTVLHDAGPVPAVDPVAEYVRLYNQSIFLLQQVLKELRGQGDTIIRPLQAAPQGRIGGRCRIKNLILVNSSAAGAGVVVNVGLTPYGFQLPAHDTRVIPIDILLPDGGDINLVGDGMTGWYTARILSAETQVE
jgi:hypothetical protein